MSDGQVKDPSSGKARFRFLGAGSLGAGVLSWLLGGLWASGVGVLAVATGYLGAKRKQRFSQLGLFLGGMATLFVCMQDLGIVQRPKALLSDRARLVHSIEASIKAHDLLKASPMSKQERARLIAVLEEGLVEARKVNAGWIDRKAPGFEENYREGFIRGTELLVKGLREGSSDKSLQGGLGLEQWGRWNRENRDALARIPEPKPSIAAYIAAWVGRGSR